MREEILRLPFFVGRCILRVFYCGACNACTRCNWQKAMHVQNAGATFSCNSSNPATSMWRPIPAPIERQTICHFLRGKGPAGEGGSRSDDQCFELWWGFMLDTVAVWQIVPERQPDSWTNGWMAEWTNIYSTDCGIGASFMASTSPSSASIDGSWRREPAPYSSDCPQLDDLLSVNKELKSVGLHFVSLSYSPYSTFTLSHSAMFFFFLLLLYNERLAQDFLINAFHIRRWFHLCAQQFCNKISPACKLKLHCNWLIHAYIMLPLPQSHSQLWGRGSAPKLHCFCFVFIVFFFFMLSAPFDFIA